MTIIESGITLNFPDTNFFRFQDCQGYKDIQNNFKEMDVCWYDRTNDILYIIELKDWGDGRLIEEENIDYDANTIAEIKEGITKSRINTLIKKSVDSISMFMSILLNRPYAATIQGCSPFTITSTSTIKLISIVNWNSNDTTYVSTVNSKYKENFKPYATLFGVKSYMVMTKLQAISQFTWIS